MKILQYWCAAVLSFLCVLVGQGQARAADEYVGSQFTDGTVFSEVVVKDHLVAIPFPNVHGPLAFGSIDSWLLRWKIDNLKTNQPNYPEHVIYLAHQKRTGQMAYGFRASASSFFVACNSSNTVELYSTTPKKPAQLLKSIPADDPATSPTPPRIFSRSEKYFFLWKPAPAIYAVSNFSVVKQLKVTESFKNFDADLRKERGSRVALTDDLKYLIYVPLEFGGPFNQVTIIDAPHCYNLETDEYTKWKIHGGTNAIVIVSTESIAGSPTFIAFWEASGSKHLGVLDRDSQLVAELPIQGTRNTQFARNCDWDYAHSKFLIREPGGKLTIYDYRTKQTQHFSLAKVGLRSP